MALVVMLPLVALHGYTLYQQYHNAQADAFRTVSRYSADTAKEIAALLMRAQTLLTVLGSRDDVVSLEPARCRQALRGLVTIDPLYLNLAVVGLDGRLACLGVATPHTAPDSFKGRAWFEEAVLLGAPHLSRPLPTALQDEPPASVLSVPLRDQAGRQVGLVAVYINLAALADRIAHQGLPEGSSFTLVDPESIVLTRFPDALQWIGKQTPRSVRDARAKAPHGVVFVAGPDGVDRAYAITPVGQYQLRLAVGIPTEQIFAAPRAMQQQSYLVAAATLGLAVLLSFLAGRSLGRPILSLSRTAKAWAQEVPGTRADDMLPGEFSALAREFNGMIDAREASEAKLMESERRYAAMLDGVDLSAINLNTDGRLVYCNEALLRLTGWTRVEILGGSWARRFLPSEHLAQNDTLMASLAGGSVPLRHENEILTRSGERRLMRWANAPLRSADGQVIGVSSIGEDVTERREAERARQASAAAEAANKAKTEFLTRMSHELRTPLNAVLGFSQLLQISASEQLNAAQRQQLDLIYLGGMQLRSIVNDVLDLSQIESGRLSINRTMIPLHELLDSVVHLSEPQAQPSSIQLVRSYAAQAPLQIHTDEVRLRQVLLNLVSNGIKYNHPGGIVRIDLTVMDQEVQVLVEDNGMGMTAEQMAQLFQPFNRLGRESGQVAGSGIGMTLSLQLVRLMGGDMSVDSTPSEGTRVRVMLRNALAAAPRPVQPALAGAATAGTPLPPQNPSRPSTIPASQPSHGAEGSPHGVVLYIEDNWTNTFLVQELLSRWAGVRLLLAEDGESGLRQAMEGAQAVDVILLDMQLPDMQGLDVLKRLRAHPETSTLPIVALSANAMPEEIDTARRAGATAYWTKPINFPAFLSGMAALLTKSVPSAD